MRELSGDSWAIGLCKHPLLNPPDFIELIKLKVFKNSICKIKSYLSLICYYVTVVLYLE